MNGCFLDANKARQQIFVKVYIRLKAEKNNLKPINYPMAVDLIYAFVKADD